MKELTFTPTVKSKGRNPFNADTLRVELLSDGKGSYVFFDNRVASTGNYNMGWVAMPADKQLIHELAVELHRIADTL